MKRLLAIIALLAAILPASRAVTPEELEQAKTYAAIVYLRNANPGSDYLDKVSVGSRTALKSKLHNDKDRENLELFNRKLPSTSGFESWGKEELSDYAQKAVVAPGNYQSTGYARSMVKSRIAKMSVQAPSKQSKANEEAQQQPTTEEPIAMQMQTTDSIPAATLPDAMDTRQAEAEDALSAAEDSIMNEQPLPQQNASSSGSNTIYIVILIILVVAVVALVIYAARYFTRQEKAKRSESADEETESRSYSRVEPEQEPDQDPQRIIESLRAENRELRHACEEYKYHINYLKSEKEKADTERLRTENRPSAALTSTAARIEDSAPAETLNDRYTRTREQQTASTAQSTAPAQQQAHRIIYLGRANRDGMFVRAERNLNPQHSLFRLKTIDNVTGSYTVVDDPEVAARVLANPDLLMAVSCELEDPDTYGKESVDTVNPGTAIFEGGRWRVLRPALIRFI